MACSPCRWRSRPGDRAAPGPVCTAVCHPLPPCAAARIHLGGVIHVSTRRKFLQVSAALCAGSLVRWQLDPTGGSLFQAARALASVGVSQTAVPGKSIPQFVEALPTFVGQRVTSATFTVGMTELQQQLLPASVYANLTDPGSRAGTYVWAYQVAGQPARTPGYTVEAKRGTPTTITYVNNLPVAGKLQPLLTIDQTIHWADPLDQMGSKSPYS